MMTNLNQIIHDANLESVDSRLLRMCNALLASILDDENALPWSKYFKKVMIRIWQNMTQDYNLEEVNKQKDLHAVGAE